MESSLKSFNQAGKAFSGTATHRIIAVMEVLMKNCIPD